MGKHLICSGAASYSIALPLTEVAVGDVISFEGDFNLSAIITLDAGGSSVIKDSRYYTLSAKDVVLLKWGGTNWNVVATGGKNEAADSIVDASGFSGNLSSTDTNVQTALETVDTLDALRLTERSADPSDPAEGKMIIWQSDGTATGDDGDILIKITAGSVTKTVTIVDFSAS